VEKLCRSGLVLVIRVFEKQHQMAAFGTQSKSWSEAARGNPNPVPTASVCPQLNVYLNRWEQELRDDIKQLKFRKADPSRLKRLLTRAATLETYPLGDVLVKPGGQRYLLIADWKTHDEKAGSAYSLKDDYYYVPPFHDLPWEVAASTLKDLRAPRSSCHRIPLGFRLADAENPYLLMLATKGELDVVKKEAVQQLKEDHLEAVAEHSLLVKAKRACDSVGCKRCSEEYSDFGDATPHSIAATGATVSELVRLSLQRKNTNRTDTAGVASLKTALWAIVFDHGYSAESVCHPDNTEHIIEVGKRVADVLKYWPESARHLCALVLLHSYPDKVKLDLPGGKRELKETGQWETIVEAAVREGREETAQQLEVQHSGEWLCKGTRLIILIRGREGRWQQYGRLQR
jgi:hypothetical protein